MWEPTFGAVTSNQICQSSSWSIELLLQATQTQRRPSCCCDSKSLNHPPWCRQPIQRCHPRRPHPQTIRQRIRQVQKTSWHSSTSKSIYNIQYIQYIQYMYLYHSITLVGCVYLLLITARVYLGSHHDVTHRCQGDLHSPAMNASCCIAKIWHDWMRLAAS